MTEYVGKSGKNATIIDFFFFRIYSKENIQLLLLFD